MIIPGRDVCKNETEIHFLIHLWKCNIGSTNGTPTTANSEFVRMFVLVLDFRFYISNTRPYLRVTAVIPHAKFEFHLFLPKVQNIRRFSITEEAASIEVNNKIRSNETSSHSTSSEIIYEPWSKQSKQLFEISSINQPRIVPQQVFSMWLSF